MSIAIVLHLLSAVIWVGGMLFAHQVLRPVAAELLDPPLRQPLWVGVFTRFFPLVWGAIILIPVSGYWMIFNVLGGFGSVGIYVHLMQTIGWLMIVLFLYVYFVPFQQLKAAVAEKAWLNGKAHIDRIRDVVGINMILGLITIAIGAGGRYL
ncbi:MAG TPA: CopD family protein [Gammaproteobacteria bacterium]